MNAVRDLPADQTWLLTLAVWAGLSVGLNGLVSAAFNGGRIVAVDWRGNVLWSWRDPQFVSKHGLSASPVLYEDLLIMPFDGNGPTDVNNIGYPTAWESRVNVPLMPSFVDAGGLLFCLKESGIASCLEAETGQVVWAERLGGAYGASPVLAEGRLYCVAEDGSTVVIGADRTFKILARNRLEGLCKASPAIRGFSILSPPLGSESHLLA